MTMSSTTTSSSGLFGWFWNPDFWLPPNITWADLELSDKVQYAQFRDLYYPPVMALVMLAIRWALDNYFWSTFAAFFGLKNTKMTKAVPNDILEKVYKSGNKTSHKQIQGLAKQLDWTERQVERWLRKRKFQDQPTRMTRFCAAAWQFTYFLAAFLLGVFVLWDKPWLWNIRHCWYDFPHHSVPASVWWYYMISLSYYWSMIFSHCFEPPHKDFWEMLFHHIVTIGLLVFSWSCNLFRIGSLVLLLHDISDSLLQGAKMAKYLNYEQFCNALFAVFTVIWVVSRLGIYPCWILYSTTIDATYFTAMFPAYYVFNSLLLLLLILHIFWTYFIFKVCYNAIVKGENARDERSSSSEGCLSSSSSTRSTDVKQNGDSHRLD